MFDSLIRFIREEYRTAALIPLHAPVFEGREIAYVTDAIASTFVSSVGVFVDRFEAEALPARSRLSTVRRRCTWRSCSPAWAGTTSSLRRP